MQRRVFLLLGLLLATPLVAQANTISLQGGPVIALAANTEGQTVTLLLSGSDLYSSSDVAMQINGGVGPAPFVTAVFGDTGGLISPGTLLNGSIWANGSGGITGDPNGTNPTSSGLTTGGGFATNSFVAQSTNGVYLTLTVSTVGVPVGTYPLTLDGTIMTWITSEFDEIPVPLQFAPMTLYLGPEPASMVLGLVAAAGMSAVVIRRRQSTTGGSGLLPKI